MLNIDKIAYHNRLAHINPYLKCMIGASFLIMSVAWDHFSLLAGIILGMNILILGVAKINKKIYIKLMAFPSAFIFLSVLTTLFYFSKQHSDFLFYVKLFGYYIGYSKQTLLRAGIILMRCFAALSCIYFITLTTGFNQMLVVFKKLRIPKEIIEIMMLTYRFIFIFLEEVSQIYIAQEMRFGYINIKTSYHSLGILISNLLVRMTRRYQEMSIVLDTKLYDGEFYL